MDCLAKLEKFLEDAPNELSIDTETTGLDWADEAFMVSYAWESEDWTSAYIDLRTDPDLWVRLRQYLDIVKPNCVFHNAKFDMHKLDFYPERFDDTCLMIYLLNEHHVKGLKPAAEIILKETTDEADVLKAELRKLGFKKADGYGVLPVDIVAPYAEKDALFTLKLYSKLAPAIAKIPETEAVYLLEKRLLLDVCEIEQHGIAIDRPYFEAKNREFNDRIVKIEKRISVLVNKPVGSGKNEFNPRSPKQVLEIFASMGYTVTGTGVAELKSVDHELAKLIVEMRTVNKLNHTYITPALREAVDNIVHPNFNLTQTVTKRFSSSQATA